MGELTDAQRSQLVRVLEGAAASAARLNARLAAIELELLMVMHTITTTRPEAGAAEGAKQSC